MKNKKIVVVGGVAGGMSFANRYRRLNINDQIIVFDKGPYVSFANCGLPYYISGEINSRTKLLVAKEEMLVKRFNLDIRANSEVVKIDSNRKIVTYRKNLSLHEESYDKLILSTGAKPIVPHIEGLSDMPNFVLRNIPNLDELMAYIESYNPKEAIVIGAGFIGIEVAENLTKKGIQVHLIEKGEEVLPSLDVEMAIHAHEVLINHQVKVYTNDEVLSFKDSKAYLKSGRIIEVDFVVSSIGVMPETSIAKEAGIKTGIKQGILVDDKYQTSMPDIYAVGDAIIVKNQVNNNETLISLASPANRQGRQLADILSGLDVSNKGSIGTSIVRVFNLVLAQTGLNEKQLEGQVYRVIHLKSNHHAGYFPGATEIDLKVIFDPKTQLILGAQAVGQHGIDKRIDIIATAIKANLKVSDLQELEFSYAPPFGSAKDIVNLAGYVAQNVILGITRTYQWHEVESLLKEENTIFLDVRTKNERLSYGYIEPSLHLDMDELYQRYKEVPKDKKVIVYCQSGTRSYNAERILRAKGYDVYNLDGAYAVYGKMKARIKNV